MYRKKFKKIDKNHATGWGQLGRPIPKIITPYMGSSPIWVVPLVVVDGCVIGH